ncbi:FAD-dependent monooxygenase [Streptosporangium sp. NPDC004631]
MDTTARLKNKDILISGAGVAGPALAYWLHRHGFTPTVVERTPALRDGGYAVDFRGEAHLTVLDRMGILADVERERTNMGAMSYVNSTGKLSYDRHDDDQQRRILAEAFAGIGWETPRLLEAMWEAPDFYFDSISQVHMESWSRGRAVLLGDAACCASPLSGMGTGLAMVGAYVLAGELAAAGGDHRVGFARYEEAMRDYATGCQKSGEGVDRWMVPENRFIAWFMNQNYRLLPYVPWKGLIAKSVRKTASAITLKDYGHRSAVPSRNRR